MAATDTPFDSELNAMLEAAFEKASALYRARGFQRRIGFGRKPALINVDLANAWTRPGYPFTCEGIDDRVMPAFSSGQWAGTVPATWAAIGSDDLLFMSGGGILAHPQGPAAGVASIRQAWAAARAGTPLDEAARSAPELAAALAFFGKR